jgi:hypothetical protein
MQELQHLAFLGLSPAGTKQVLTSTVGGAELKIECEDVHALGTLELLGLSTFHLLYLQCEVTKPVECKIGSLTIATNPKLMGQTINTPPTAPQLLITGEGANEEFAKITLTNCTFEGTYPVEGLQIAELPEPEVLKVDHEIVAKKANSKLKFGGNAASYSGIVAIHLHSSLAYDLLAGT